MLQEVLRLMYLSGFLLPYFGVGLVLQSIPHVMGGHFFFVRHLPLNCFMNLSWVVIRNWWNKIWRKRNHANFRLLFFLCFSYSYVAEYNPTITKENPTKTPRNPNIIIDKPPKISDWDVIVVWQHNFQPFYDISLFTIFYPISTHFTSLSAHHARTAFSGAIPARSSLCKVYPVFLRIPYYNTV